MSADIETVVIGAGVIGLGIAAQLAQSGQKVMVLERNTKPGIETSSRNSGVIHAGLYYPPGSQRARFCTSGKDKLYRFCEDNGVPFARLGKLLVATSDDELPKLAQIAKNAKACGVTDLTPLGATQVKERAPQLQCKAALFSPSTGIVDTHELMVALEGHIHAHDGQIVLNTCVNGLSRRNDGTFVVSTIPTPPTQDLRQDQRNTQNETSAQSQPATLTCKYLVIAAGHYSTAISTPLHAQTRHTLQDAYTPPSTYYAKAHYFAMSQAAPFENLVYPLPSKSGLGIHLTMDLAGRSRFGPDVTWTNSLDYRFEDDDGQRLRAFEKSIRRYWPDLPAQALHPDSTGIRPRTYCEGQPAKDFQIHGPTEHGIPNLTALYGIESPGLTCALAISQFVADLMTQKS